MKPYFVGVMGDHDNVIVAVPLVLLGFMLMTSGIATVYALPAAITSGLPQVLGVDMVVPATAAGTTSAEIVNYGTDKDIYNRGDTAKGFITLKNTGDANIDDATISVSVARSVPVLGMMTLGSQDIKLTGLNIKPGETKNAEYSVTIPSDYKGLSTAGDYKVTGKVIVSGKDAGSFSKSIKVV
jgi:hypothetical protein